MAGAQENKMSAAEREKQWKAVQAALPDTSIRPGAGGINVLENYHFADEEIPIYHAGMNKQIDRVDMEVERARRARREDDITEDIEQNMEGIHEKLQVDGESSNQLPAYINEGTGPVSNVGVAVGIGLLVIVIIVAVLYFV